MSNSPPLHPDWIAERALTRNKARWRDELLTRVGAINNHSKEWATHVGSGVHQTQLQYDFPVSNFFSYPELGLVWAQLRVWEPNTKRPGTRVIRFGPDTGVLMVLIKVPNEKGSFDMFLLARRKYQLAGKGLFFEFARGWSPGSTKEDRGWKILEKDFPGVKDSPLVASIKETKLGCPIWENNSELSNKITHHLVVVTLRDGVTIDNFKRMLVWERVKFEYLNENPMEFDSDFLTVNPIVLQLTMAAELLNNSLIEQEETSNLFGENFSISTWTRFLALHGWQFPEIQPERAEAI